jgi:hypothetical protein
MRTSQRSGRRISEPPAFTTEYAVNWLSFSGLGLESASRVGRGVATLEVFPPLPGQPSTPAYRLRVADCAGGPPHAIATVIWAPHWGSQSAVRTEALPVALEGVSGVWGGGAFGPPHFPSPLDGPPAFSAKLWGWGVRADGSKIGTEFVAHGERSEEAHRGHQGRAGERDGDRHCHPHAGQLGWR